MTDRIRLAIIGCGAQTEFNHLRAVAASRDVHLAMLVDKDEARARAMAAEVGDPQVTGDYRRVVGSAHAAIIALPNHLHAPVTTELLRSGVHVLVEKPMALTADDCDAMIQAARSSGAVLAVGLEFRFLNQVRYVKQLLANELLGEVQSVDLRLGRNLQAYPVRTDYLLRPTAAGGGVLMDLGVHAIDLVLWWLGPCELVQYNDDAAGGVEANCEVRIRTLGGATGVIEASRIRSLRNTCIISGTRAVVEVGIWDPNGHVRLALPGQEFGLLGHAAAHAQTWRDVYTRQLGDFVESIRLARAPVVTGSEGRRSVEFIQKCYTSRTLAWEPWSVAVGERQVTIR